MDDFQSSQAFQPYLLPSEKILWTGRPKRGFALNARDSFLIPFSLLWGGFAIFWNVMVWLAPFSSDSSNRPAWFLKLWGLPFLFAGLYLIFGRFIHDARLRSRLLYAVTEQRVLVLRGSKVMSLDIRRLPRLDLSEYRDGTGTVAFEASGGMPWGGMNGFSFWVSALASSIQFFRIQDARKVYEIVRNQAAS